jgi:hypothetical protein
VEALWEDRQAFPRRLKVRQSSFCVELSKSFPPDQEEASFLPFSEEEKLQEEAMWPSRAQIRHRGLEAELPVPF